MIRLWNPLNPKDKSDDNYKLVIVFKFNAKGYKNNDKDNKFEDFVTYPCLMDEDEIGTVRGFNDFTASNKKYFTERMYEVADFFEENEDVTITDVDMEVLREEPGWFFMDSPIEQ